MFGFVFGTLCLFGLMGMFGAARHQRWHHAHAGCGDGRHGFRGGRGWGGPRGGWDRGWGWDGGPPEEGGYKFTNEGPRGDAFAKAAAEMAKRKLRIDDDQEDLVDHAFADLRTALRDLSATMKDTREPLAGAFRGEKVDDAAIATAFAQHDEAIARARKDVVSSLKQIHAVLTPEQRQVASEWLSSQKWV